MQAPSLQLSCEASVIDIEEQVFSLPFEWLSFATMANGRPLKSNPLVNIIFFPFGFWSMRVVMYYLEAHPVTKCLVGLFGCSKAGKEHIIYVSF